MGQNGKKILRHFQLKLKTADGKKLFNQFQRNVIMSGAGVTDVLMVLIKQSGMAEKTDSKLLYEPEMLELMQKKKVGFTRQSLKRMRDNGELVDDKGNSLWGTDGATIIYDSGAVIDLLKTRGKGRARAANG